MKFIRIIAALLFTCSVANAQFSPGFPSSGSAGVSSISTACGATSTGGPSTGAVTVSSLETPSTVTSGNYSTSNCGNVVYYNSASDQTPTIPLAATAGAGAAFKTCSVQHSQTVTASGSDNIGATGAATTISLPTGTATAPSCIEFTSDGTSRWTPLVYGGSGGTPGGSNTQIQYNNSSAFGGVSGWTTNGSNQVTNTQAPAANTAVAGLILADTTSASSGNQQYSPCAQYTGQGWKTTATAASEPVDWQVCNVPVQSTTTPFTELAFFSQINSGGYSNVLGISAGGYLLGGASTTLPTNAYNNAPWFGYDSPATGWIAGNANCAQCIMLQGSGAGTQVIMSKGGLLAWTSNAGNATTGFDTFMGRTAAATLNLGQADAAAPVAQTFGVQSVVTGTANTGGANWILDASNSTGTGVGGKFIVQTTVTGSSGSTPNSQFPMLSLNPGSATTSTLQLGDGTNITTYDSCTALTTGATGVVACTASAMRFKNILGSLSEDEASHGLDQLHAGEWVYKDQYQTQFGGGAEHVSLYADDVAKMDPRCVTRDGDGQVHDYWDRCVIAYLVADRQKMKAEIVSLQQRVH